MIHLWLLGDELSEGNMNEGGWNLVDVDTNKIDSSASSESEIGTDPRVLLRKESSFAWRGGQERQTTGKVKSLWLSLIDTDRTVHIIWPTFIGIWMWSEPFIRTSTTTGEKLAVLLMDTQGMFDNETTMTLTAQIFGLSTLVSSYQVCVSNIIHQQPECALISTCTMWFHSDL